MNTRFLRFKMESLSDEGEVEGHGSVRDNVDLGGDRVKAGAFTATIKARQRPDGGFEPLPMLWSHDPEQPIGVWSEVREDSKGLYVKGRIDLNVQRGREVHSLMRMGCIKGLSIGYSTVRDTVVRGIRELLEVKLFEVSPVVFPMNPLAQVDNVKSADRATRLAALSTSAAKFVESFDDALADRSLYTRRLDMNAILDRLTFDLVYDDNMERDEKLAAFDEILNQYHSAQLAWLADVLDEMAADAAEGEVSDEGKSTFDASAIAEIKAGRVLSTSTRAAIMKAHDFAHQARKCLKALLDAHPEKDDPADASQSDKGADGAATKNLDPAQHSQSQEHEASDEPAVVAALTDLRNLRASLVSPEDSATR